MYFPTSNSNLYLPSFITPQPSSILPDAYNPFNQTYQYQPIYYNSVNILTQSLNNSNQNNCIIAENNQTSIRITNNNNNNFCGYCLPASTTSSSATAAATNNQQELLITGNSSAQVEPALILSQFTEINLSDTLKYQSLINNNNNNLSDNTSAAVVNSFHKEFIMVSISRNFNERKMISFLDIAIAFELFHLIFLSLSLFFFFVSLVLVVYTILIVYVKFVFLVNYIYLWALLASKNTENKFSNDLCNIFLLLFYCVAVASLNLFVSQIFRKSFKNNWIIRT